MNATLARVTTPALVLDKRRLLDNRGHIVAKCRSLGVTLRPHMKTLKSIEAARYAIDPSHGDIAVSTFREAEYFAGNGIADIQYAVCRPPDCLDIAASIAGSAPGFSGNQCPLEHKNIVANG
jgi:D-serine deaminase-like pyridoxal phosphate-dependent protein